MYRGVSTLSCDKFGNFPAFQTWGQGFRFACVPVNRQHGINGPTDNSKLLWQWFAAVEDKFIPTRAISRQLCNEGRGLTFEDMYSVPSTENTSNMSSSGEQLCQVIDTIDNARILN